MARNKPEGICRICGTYDRLTFEHTPPRSAGNMPYQRALDLAYHIPNGLDIPVERMRKKKLPRGSGGYYLCGRCNNFTGAKYATDYAIWAHQGAELRNFIGDANSIALPFHIFPNRVFKQILSIFAATCNEGFVDANSYLRKLILEPHAKGFPNNKRLYCYVVNPESESSRQSGVIGALRGTTTHCFAEFAFPPFGYILTLSGTPPIDDKLFDITFFGYHNYDDYRDLHLPIPVRPVESFFPGDFRNKTEWENANRRLAMHV